MKNKLMIIGASGHGKVVVDIAIKMKKWKDNDQAKKEYIKISTEIFH